MAIPLSYGRVEFSALKAQGVDLWRKFGPPSLRAKWKLKSVAKNMAKFRIPVAGERAPSLSRSRMFWGRLDDKTDCFSVLFPRKWSPSCLRAFARG